MTTEQVRALFRQRGITFTRWVEENGYNRNEVYHALNGQTKTHYGKSHKIAVKLGLKSTAQAAWGFRVLVKGYHISQKRYADE